MFTLNWTVVLANVALLFNVCEVTVDRERSGINSIVSTTFPVSLSITVATSLNPDFEYTTSGLGIF